MNASSLMGGYSACTTPGAARDELVSVPDGAEASVSVTSPVISWIASIIAKTLT
ncbi:hypothetical protein ACFVUY_21175 [Kitasatospora sp. NPDC058063]|uniref:hypothetical protein n=1 Tax=unclassified Kitasatospora TaxID=2633591 RepID=UPI0036DB5726